MEDSALSVSFQTNKSTMMIIQLLKKKYINESLKSLSLGKFSTLGILSWRTAQEKWYIYINIYIYILHKFCVTSIIKLKELSISTIS